MKKSESIILQSAAAKPGSTAEDLNDPAYLKIRDLIYEISGIYQPQEKLYLLASRCARRMASVNAATPGEYLAHLTVRANRETELRSLLNEITIGETYMFRSPAQLDALRNVILPELIKSKAGMGFQTTAALERRLLHRRRAVHAGDVPARRKRKAAFGVDFRYSGHRPE